MNRRIQWPHQGYGLVEQFVMLLGLTTVFLGSKTISLVAIVAVLVWLGRRWFIEFLGL
jgi:hypothetical protein